MRTSVTVYQIFNNNSLHTTSKIFLHCRKVLLIAKVVSWFKKIGCSIRMLCSQIWIQTGK